MSAMLKRAHSTAISSPDKAPKKAKFEEKPAAAAAADEHKEAVNPAAAADESKDAEVADESGYESPCAAASPKLCPEHKAADDRKLSSGRGSSLFKEAIMTAALAADRANKVDRVNESGYVFAQPDGEARFKARLDRKAAPHCEMCEEKINRALNPKDATAHILCDKCFWLGKCEHCKNFFSGEFIGSGKNCGYCVHAEEIGVREEGKIVRAFEVLAAGIKDVVKSACEKEPELAGPMAMLLRQIGTGTRFKFCRGCNHFNGELIPQLGGLCEPCSENRMLDERYARRNGRMCRGVKIEDLGERGVESDSDSESDDDDESEPDSDENTLSGEMYVDDEAEDDEDESDSGDEEAKSEDDEPLSTVEAKEKKKKEKEEKDDE